MANTPETSGLELVLQNSTKVDESVAGLLENADKQISVLRKRSLSRKQSSNIERRLIEADAKRHISDILNTANSKVFTPSRPFPLANTPETFAMSEKENLHQQIHSKGSLIASLVTGQDIHQIADNIESEYNLVDTNAEYYYSEDTTEWNGLDWNQYDTQTEWVEHFDEASGYPYYENLLTGETTWDCPESIYHEENQSTGQAKFRASDWWNQKGKFLFRLARNRFSIGQREAPPPPGVRPSGGNLEPELSSNECTSQSHGTQSSGHDIDVNLEEMKLEGPESLDHEKKQTNSKATLRARDWWNRKGKFLFGFAVNRFSRETSPSIARRTERKPKSNLLSNAYMSPKNDAPNNDDKNIVQLRHQQSLMPMEDAKNHVSEIIHAAERRIQSMGPTRTTYTHRSQSLEYETAHADAERYVASLLESIS